jgi:hypothetical protein
MLLKDFKRKELGSVLQVVNRGKDMITNELADTFLVKISKERS